MSDSGKGGPWPANISITGLLMEELIDVFGHEWNSHCVPVVADALCLGGTLMGARGTTK